MRNVKFTLTIVLLAVLTGCNQLAPIEFEMPSTTEATAVIILPTDMIATDVPASATPAPPSAIPGPTVTFMGPIVGEGYAPPATNPPPVTTTPMVQPSPTTETRPTDVPAAPTQEPPTDVPPTAAPARAGTPLPALDTSNVGIQVYSRVEQEEWDVIMNQVANDLQMGWVKVQVSWDFFQPDGPDPNHPELRRLEIYLEQMRQIRGVNVLVSVAKEPEWAAADGIENDPQQLAEFVTFMLNSFGQAVDAVEVWNEPNLAREWRGQQLDGGTYMLYYDAVYNAVRAYSPDITVVSAGLAPTGDTGETRNDREYLREMYNAGLANYTNAGVGVHPYGWGNPPDARCCDLSEERGWDDAPQFFLLDTLEDYREIMVAYGDTDAQLWATEFGWATWEGLPGNPPDSQIWMTYNDKWDQANYNLRAIQLMQQLDYIGPMFLWNLNFAQPVLIEQRDERVAYSIVLPEGAPRERPFYWMFFDAVRPDEQLERYD